MTIRKTLLTLTIAAMMIPVGASASDITAPSTELTVQSSTDGMIKLGAKAFQKGEFERSIAYHNRALKSGLSKKRKAVAQSNICAANAALGNMEAAREACDAALELRPGFEPAQNNKAALTVMLAQK